MLNENAKKWVAALRSGEFSQTRGNLANDCGSSHCCLGVACVLYEREVGRLPDGWEHFATLAGGLAPVRVWLGLNDRVGTYRAAMTPMGSPATAWLAADNDAGKTFAEIADIIESEPEGLFVTAAP